MNPRLLLTTLLIPAAALAQQQQPQGQAPEPQAQAQQAAADPYAERNKRVQEALRQRGFYDGPVNGEIGPNTQAAIAQFQLSLPMPVSGMLDDSTLAALGVEPSQQAAAGASTETQAPSPFEGRPLSGSCDQLIGPEKDRCLQRGGTVEASTNASGGENAPATPKGN